MPFDIFFNRATRGKKFVKKYPQGGRWSKKRGFYVKVKRAILVKFQNFVDDDSPDGERARTK